MDIKKDKDMKLIEEKYNGRNYLIPMPIENEGYDEYIDNIDKFFVNQDIDMHIKVHIAVNAWRKYNKFLIPEVEEGETFSEYKNRFMLDASYHMGIDDAYFLCKDIFEDYNKIKV